MKNDKTCFNQTALQGPHFTPLQAENGSKCRSQLVIQQWHFKLVTSEIVEMNENQNQSVHIKTARFSDSVSLSLSYRATSSMDFKLLERNPQRNVKTISHGSNHFYLAQVLSFLFTGVLAVTASPINDGETQTQSLILTFPMSVEFIFFPFSTCLANTSSRDSAQESHNKKSNFRHRVTEGDQE